MSVMTCRGRYQLLNLAPGIQELIDPTVRKGKRSDFPINVAQALDTITGVVPENFLMMFERFGLQKESLLIDHEAHGEHALSFAIQHAVLAHIQSQNMSAGQAMGYIANGKATRTSNKHGTGRKSSFGRSPEKIRQTLKQGLSGPTKSVSVTLTRDMMRHGFADQPLAKVEEMLLLATASLEEIERLQGILQNIRHAKQNAATSLPRQVMTPIPPPRTMRDMSAAEIAKVTARYQK